MIAWRAKALHGICLCLAVGLAQAEPFGYVVNSDSPESDAFSLVRVNLATGEFTVIGETGYLDIEGLALAPDGTLYGADDITKTLVTIDLDTGAASPVDGVNGNLGLPVGEGEERDFGLTFDSQGILWMSSDVTGEMWQVDPATGAATLVNAGADTAPLTGLAACGDELYGLGAAPDQRLHRINRDTFDAEPVGPLTLGTEFDDGGLAFDPEGILWGIADRSTFRPPGSADIDILNQSSVIFRVDPGNGAANQVATTVVGVESLAIEPPGECQTGGAGNPVEAASIPVLHPAGLAAAILALLGTGLAARRRQ